MKKVAVVTGGSSGIGLAVCNALVEKGFLVVELSRREKKSSENIIHIKTDVLNSDEINNAMKKASKYGEIKALVCSAGGGISGAIEFTEEEQSQWLFDLNFFGVERTLRSALPYMRKSGGNIIIISSVAAALSIPFQTYYSASKAALNALAAGLANEVRTFGINVCAVMPGDIKTDFTTSRRKLHIGDDIYCGRISRSVSMMENDEQNGGSPKQAGLFIANLAQKKRLRPLYVIGFKYKLFVFAAKLLPFSFVNWIVGKLYG